MTSLQRRITINSTVIGTALALVVFAADAAGWLQPLEWWLYDLRAATCQYFTKPPAADIVHLDIDDEALDAIGPWPWRRSELAAMLDEIALAKPKAVAIDVIFAEPQRPTIEPGADGTMTRVDEDAALVAALRRLNCAILPASFSFTPPQTSATILHAAAVAELRKDLKLSTSELSARLASANAAQGEKKTAKLEADFDDIRRDAIYASVLQAALDPAAAPLPTDDPKLAPIIAAAQRRVTGELALRRFSLVDPKLEAQPPDVSVNLAPLPQLSQAIAGAGFADYNVFTEAVVRTVPLFVRQANQIYTQLGLALACKLLDADLSNAKFTDRYIYLPTPTGTVRVPVRERYSVTQKRNIGLLMDIPWFGTSDWKTMYDYPQYRHVSRHYSIAVAFDIVDAKRKIAANNMALDAALISKLLSPERAAEFADRHFTADDFNARRSLAEQTLADLQADGWDELLAGKSDAELSQKERDVRVGMANARAALQANTELAERIVRKRVQLGSEIAGKGVLIGWVATSTGDIVTTSLHARCPGVVVHGVIAGAILNRDFLYNSPRIATVLLTLLFGLLATALTSRMPPARGVPLLLIIAAAYVVADGLLLYDRLNIIVNTAAPLVAMAVCWAGCLVVRLVLEGIERIKMARDAAVIGHEITLARQVQAALIPKQLKILETVDSYGWTLAATTTGGDCFDLWQLADGRLGILVADASGHGLGPSIIVSEVRALVRALCDLYNEPQKLLERVNHRLASDLQGSKFCTTFVGFLGEDGVLSWGSAGHGPMLWCSTHDGALIELEGTGLPLGVSEDWFGDENVPPLQLEPGGWIAVMSDGIFEAMDPKGDLFTIDRVKTSLNGCCGAPCETVVNTLRDAVLGWQQKDEPADDQTIVVIRRNAQVAPNCADPNELPTGLPASAGSV